jgi:hypothetical protein
MLFALIDLLSLSMLVAISVARRTLQKEGKHKNKAKQTKQSKAKQNKTKQNQRGKRSGVEGVRRGKRGWLVAATPDCTSRGTLEIGIRGMSKCVLCGGGNLPQN